MEEIVKRGRGRPRKHPIGESPREKAKEAAVAMRATAERPMPGRPPKAAVAASERGAGRPEYEPKKADRKVVEEMKAFGETNNMIARALEISEPTLTKYFADELLNGVARKRREAITLQWEAARTGKQSAINKVLEHTGITAADDKLKNLPADEVEKAIPAVKLGKKELAMKAAETAGIDSGWGSDLMPIMAVRN